MRRALGLAAVVIAAMALGRVITETVPLDSDASAAPFITRTDLGKTAHLEYVDVRVTGVKIAEALTGVDALVVPGKNGVFLLVDTVLTPKSRTQFYFGLQVVDAAGRSYSASLRATGCPLNIAPLNGLTTYATLCFEMPKDSLVGAHFRLGRGDISLAGAFQRRDAVADIHLGISAADATQMLGQHVYYAVPDPAFQPPTLTPHPMPTQDPS